MSALRRHWPVVLGCLLLSLALRAHDFGNPVIGVDEEYYLLVGSRMLHGALPYVDLWDRKPVGLFALYAAIAALPGDGIVAYQLVAALFAAATAFLVQRMARIVGAGARGSLVAAACYLIWLHFFTGGGGQSPVFYNLFVAGAALLTLRLPGRRTPRAVIASGAAACLLAGIAIQIKYTAAVEGAMIGLAHLWTLRRVGARWPSIGGAVAGWIALGLAPTLVAVAIYAALGPAAFRAFWFSNFESILLRGHYRYPAAVIAGRLAGSWAQLAPLLIAAAATMWRVRTAEVRLAALWLVAALGGYVSIGVFFDDYALPLVAPFAVLAAPTLGRAWVAVAVLALGLGDYAVRAATAPDDGPAVRRVAALVAADSQGGCPYVFIGDAIIYHLAHACIPTRYAFPSTLAYAPEAGATGVDEAAEVARIMATRPPLVLTASTPLAEWNARSQAIVDRALAQDYRLVLKVPREDYTTLVYRRR